MSQVYNSHVPRNFDIALDLQLDIEVKQWKEHDVFEEDTHGYAARGLVDKEMDRQEGCG